MAAGGTLFLDEVGEITLPVQVKLLRAIQEKSIRRVGGTSDLQIDVRIVAATNRDLAEGVRQGTFREDLYYRINVIEIELPPLRERADDIPLLVDHFIAKHAQELGKPVDGISEAAMDILLDHPFPGNVRELENVIERAVALCHGSVVETESLPPTLSKPMASAKTTRIPPEGIDLDAVVNDYERTLLDEALRASGGVKKRAAQLVGVSFRSFRYRLEKLGLDPNDEG
jgi:two-component system response regulator PilR (NtrC family)